MARPRHAYDYDSEYGNDRSRYGHGHRHRQRLSHERDTVAPGYKYGDTHHHGTRSERHGADAHGYGRGYAYRHEYGRRSDDDEYDDDAFSTVSEASSASDWSGPGTEYSSGPGGTDTMSTVGSDGGWTYRGSGFWSYNADSHRRDSEREPAAVYQREERRGRTGHTDRLRRGEEGRRGGSGGGGDAPAEYSGGLEMVRVGRTRTPSAYTPSPVTPERAVGSTPRYARDDSVRTTRDDGRWARDDEHMHRYERTHEDGDSERRGRSPWRGSWVPPPPGWHGDRQHGSHAAPGTMMRPRGGLGYHRTPEHVSEHMHHLGAPEWHDFAWHDRGRPSTYDTQRYSDACDPPLSDYDSDSYDDYYSD
ncbi:hypothetical protein H0H81_005892 [Sphagnurus paluster]|uniref:Uncharacterized protein n=1 Tax=Sphagnurus paluster TaxID=117069 RepID=A0A9P7FYX0_9AGAR|nr:hypothetical protein H0H81_005892 [Sphagnurus paluster]